jgi:hypothetical protein
MGSAFQLSKMELTWFIREPVPKTVQACGLLMCSIFRVPMHLDWQHGGWSVVCHLVQMHALINFKDVEEDNFNVHILYLDEWVHFYPLY